MIKPTGRIKFKDMKKTEYSVDDILDLIEYNIGFSVVPRSHIAKRESPDYNNAKQTIRRKLAGKELANSTSRNYLYSKSDVLLALNAGLYAYFLKKANMYEEYQEKVKSAGKNVKDRIAEIAIDDGTEKYVEKLKFKIEMGIIIDYFKKNILDIDEDLIEADIYKFMELGSCSLEELSDTEYLAIERVLGNYDEYYSAKKE